MALTYAEYLELCREEIEDSEDPWRFIPCRQVEPDHQPHRPPIILPPTRHHASGSVWAMCSSPGYTALHPKPTYGFREDGVL